MGLRAWGVCSCDSQYSINFKIRVMDWPLTASESGKHFQTQEDSWFELSSAFGSFAISGSDLEACFVTPSVISTFSVCNISNFALQKI